MTARRGVVFVDADDTLWENNRWFTRVIDDWAAFVAARGADRETALLALHEEEDRHIPIHGYGARPFVHSLRTAFARVVAAPSEGDLVEFERLARASEESIREHPIDLLPGVDEGLTRLAETATRMVVLTKGQPDEQEAKVARSGLARHFEAVRVVPEKDVVTYVAAAAALDAPVEACWMVGNSPRSDINPARRAGMRTVHVPHAAPWHRELAPLAAEGPPTHVATTFADVPAILLREGVL
jgi:putative hydrolase of the HAD superfamily